MKYLKISMILFLIVVHSSLTYARNDSSLEFIKLDNDEYIINIELSSGTKINNIRYSKFMNDWFLEVTGSYNASFSIKSIQHPTNRLTNEEFMELIDKLFSYLHKDKKPWMVFNLNLH